MQALDSDDIKVSLEFAQSTYVKTPFAGWSPKEISELPYGLGVMPLLRRSAQCLIVVITIRWPCSPPSWACG